MKVMGVPQRLAQEAKRLVTKEGQSAHLDFLEFSKDKTLGEVSIGSILVWYIMLIMGFRLSVVKVIFILKRCKRIWFTSYLKTNTFPYNLAGIIPHILTLIRSYINWEFRRVLARLIDEPEREDWKSYPQTIEQEAAMTNKFKQAFMPFDFTLQQ